MNARKLQQIQDFEKKAFGKVTADSFHTTLLNIEATLVPIVSFVQRGINTPVFGYHIINKYTIVGAIVAYVAFHTQRKNAWSLNDLWKGKSVSTSSCVTFAVRDGF